MIKSMVTSLFLLFILVWLFNSKSMGQGGDCVGSIQTGYTMIGGCIITTTVATDCNGNTCTYRLTVCSNQYVLEEWSGDCGNSSVV